MSERVREGGAGGGRDAGPISGTGERIRVEQVDTGDDALPMVVVRTDRLIAGFLPTLGARMILLAATPGGGSRDDDSGEDGLASLRNLLWCNPEYLDRAFRSVRPRRSWRPLDGTQASWANVGGAKTWIAPQGSSGPGEWAGPPDPVIDSGVWELETDLSGGRATLAFTSRADERSGLVVGRRFSFGCGREGATETVSFRNWSTRPVTWAIWEVVQVGTADPTVGGAGEAGPAESDRGRRSLGVGEVRVDNDPAVPAILSMRLRGHMSAGVQEGSWWRLPVRDAVGKVLFPGGRGRVCYVAPDGASLSLSYPVSAHPGAVYPDDGARCEVWMQSPQDLPVEEAGGLRPTANLVELEALSSLVTLDSGGSMEMTIEWAVTAPRMA